MKRKRKETKKVLTTFHSFHSDLQISLQPDILAQSVEENCLRS